MTGRISASCSRQRCLKNGSISGRGQNSPRRTGRPASMAKARRQKTQPSTRSGWMSLVSRIGK
jgi:hypothetical protein